MDGRNNFGVERYSAEVIAFLRTDKSLAKLFPPRYTANLANAFIDPIRIQGIREPEVIVKTVIDDARRKARRRKQGISQFEAILLDAIRDNKGLSLYYAEHRIKWEDLSNDEKKIVKQGDAQRIHKGYMLSKFEEQKIIPFLQV